jgi:anti-anti-sigma factor
MFEEYEYGYYRTILVDQKITHDNAPEFRDYMLLHAGTAKVRCIVDLTHCKFLCSQAIATIGRSAQLCRQLGGELRILNASNRLQRLFRMVHMEDLILTQQTVQCTQSK